MRVALIAASLVLGALLPVHADGGFGGPSASSGANVEVGPAAHDGASVGGGLGEPVRGAPGDTSRASETGGYSPRLRTHPPQTRTHPPRVRRSVAEAQATAEVDGVWRDPRIAVPLRVSEPGAGFDPRSYTGYYGYTHGGGAHGKGGGHGGYSADEGRVPIPESFKSWKAWGR